MPFVCMVAGRGYITSNFVYLLLVWHVVLPKIISLFNLLTSHVGRRLEGVPHIRDLLLSFRHKGLPTPLSNCVIGCCYVTNQPRVSHRQSLDTRYTALYSMKTGFPSLGGFSMARKSQVIRVIECLESGSLSIGGIKAAKRAPIFLLSVLQHSQYFYHHSQHLSHHSQYFSYHSQYFTITTSEPSDLFFSQRS